MNLIELHHLSKTFKPSLLETKEVLKDLNFQVKAGEFIALKGANGSGKTTLLNIILGLIKPSQGEVKLFGKNPQDFTSKTRVGVVLQKVAIPKQLKVKELVDLLRSYYPDSLTTEDILKTVNLTHKQDSWAANLSGGEEQRLLFALALAGNPDLLILDEPTRNLDEEGFTEFWQQIKICRDKNITILMVTNNQTDRQYLDELVTRYITLKEGKLEETVIQSVAVSSDQNLPQKLTKVNYISLLFKQMFFELLQLIRMPIYLLGIFLFPTLIVFFPMNQNSAQLILTFYSGLILLILAIERLGKRIAIDRAEGWLRLLQVTPLPPSVLIRSKILINLLLSSLILLLLFSFAAFRLDIQETLTSWLTLSAYLLLGMIPFAIFGLAMGYLLSPKTVDSIIGLSVPIALLTCGLPISDAQWFKDMLNFSPFYHYSQFVLYQANFSTIKSDDQPLFHLLFLIAFGLFFYLLTIWAYQRDQSLS